MINLLPPDQKTDIIFARRNAVLKNWIVASCIGVVGIIVVIAAGQFFISRSTTTWQKQVSSMRAQLDAQNQAEVQKQVTNISDSVKLTLQVLERQVLFSKLLVQVGAAMPSGTTLNSLSISSTQGGLDLAASAKDYQTATQVQLNLSDPQNKLFEKADIIGVNCDNTTKTPTGGLLPYPCKITIRALFAKNNAFQYTKTAPAAGATP